MKPFNALVALMLATTGLLAHAAPAAPALTQSGTLTAEVLETRNVEVYTYLRLKTADGEIWAAVPTTAVKKGDRVTLVNTMTMRNFESKTLGRRFDQIVFGDIVGSGGKSAAPHGATAASAAAVGRVAKVAKVEGSGGHTVAELVTGRLALKDKTVLVRGQVVKVNHGILGKNWLHLQDGSGSASDGSQDILVTTKGEAAVGDVVVAQGTVRVDVTVGPGYAYKVLIEDAVLRR